MKRPAYARQRDRLCALARLASDGCATSDPRVQPGDPTWNKSTAKVRCLPRSSCSPAFSSAHVVVAATTARRSLRSTPTAAPGTSRPGRHRNLSGQGELSRSDPRGAWQQWPRVFGLPHGLREFPADPGGRADKVYADDPDRRRRSAVSRDRRRRLPRQRRGGARLHQPDAERFDPSHDPAARQRQAPRLRGKGPVPGIGAADQRDGRRRLALRSVDPRRQHHRPRWCRSGMAARAESERRLPARRPHRHVAKPGAERTAQPCRDPERPAGELPG